MIAQVLSMLELAKQALQEESQELATAVFAKDNMLDEINAEATAILADYISRASGECTLLSEPGERVPQVGAFRRPHHEYCRRNSVLYRRKSVKT